MTSRFQVVAALVLVPGAVATTFASARPAPPVIDYVAADQFEEMRAFAAATGTMGGTVAVARDEQASFMVVRRTHESEVEEHSRWDDVVIVRAGSGAIVFGPRAHGARLLAPGELRGGVLARREARVLRVGDLARIPAGVPHAFVPSGAQPWELLIVKVRRPNRPLKRTSD